MPNEDLDRQRRVMQTLEGALGVSLSDRTAYLRDACGDDTSLMRDVKSLLDTDAIATDFLTPPIDAVRSMADPDTAVVGKNIGDYRVEKLIASGGMGAVYLARQESPNRQVALKLIRTGLTTPDMRRRLAHEAQILAHMRHPNIAQIFEAGIHEDEHGALPYFAMEYVPGAQPINRYAEAEGFSVVQRLELFMKVADAVEHGHQRGVIHRDLKPGNILVDEAGQIKVIDFGVALATDLDLTVTTMQAAEGIVGTLRYMSPEQCTGSAHEIDTRSDVYALGVVLFELLTKRLPYDVSSSIAFEIPKIIRERPATRPSLIEKSLRGDLETILLKTLAKQKDRRYASVAALHGDLERFLRREPIEARRPTVMYRARMFARRNRAFVSAIFATSIILISAVAVSLLFAVSARRERDVSVWQAYVGSIAAADSAYQARELPRMRSALTAAPAQHRNWEWRYLDRLAHRSALTIDDHEHMVSEVAYSPDGSRIASSARDGTVRLWDATTGVHLKTWPGHNNGAFGIAFSQDGRRLAATLNDHTVVIYNALTGREERRLGRHAGDVFSIAFHPDGRQLVSASSDGMVQVWDREQVDPLSQKVLKHGDVVRNSIYSPDGTLLATAGDEGVIRLYDTRDYTPVGVDMIDDAGEIRGLAFTPDGRLLASASDDGTVKLWNVETCSVVHPPFRGHEGPVWSVAISRDGQYLASGSEDHSIRLFSLESGECLATLWGHGEVVYSVAFSPDGSHLASGSWDWTVRVWDLGAFRHEGRFRGHDDRVLALAVSPDGSRLVSGSLDKNVRIWSVTTGRCLAVLEGRTSAIRSVAYHPQNDRIASGSSDGTVRIWNATTGAEILPPFGHPSGVYSVVYSPDGGQLATSHQDGSIFILDAVTGDPVAVPRGHNKSRARPIAYSPDGRTLASGSIDRTVRMWDASTGEAGPVMRGHVHEVYAVAFSPDGRYLASGGRDQTIGIWDAETGQQITMLRGHGQWVTGLAFSPDSTRLVSASWFKTLKLWDTRTWQEVATLREHGDALRCVVFSPDGTRIVASSNDSTIRMWDLVPPVERVQQLNDAIARAEEAIGIVENLISAGHEPDDIARTLRSDTSLHPAMKDAAMDALLQRCSR